MFETFWISLCCTHRSQHKTSNDLNQSILKQTGSSAADTHTAQPSMHWWWGRWLGKANLTSYAALKSIIFQTSDTCLAEAVNNQMLIPVMLSTVTSVCKALGVKKETVGMGKEIYRDWVCLNKCEFNNAPHQAN